MSDLNLKPPYTEQERTAINAVLRIMRGGFPDISIFVRNYFGEERDPDRPLDDPKVRILGAKVTVCRGAQQDQRR